MYFVMKRCLAMNVFILFTFEVGREDTRWDKGWHTSCLKPLRFFVFLTLHNSLVLFFDLVSFLLLGSSGFLQS